MWPLAKLKLGVLSMATTWLFVWFAPASRSAETRYQRVYSGDIIMGYVPAGQSIETSGYLWFSDAGVFLNVGRASAHVPLIVDVSRLPPAQRVQIQIACSAAAAGRSGGCDVTIRGHTATVGSRHAVLAEDIDLPH